jgi:hypothetical protein
MRYDLSFRIALIKIKIHKSLLINFKSTELIVKQNLFDLAKDTYFPNKRH